MSSSRAARRSWATVAQFLDSLSYDPATGVFTRPCGRIATCKGPNGYLVVYCTIDSKKTCTTAQRAAVYKMTGEMPVGVVDHVDGDRTNNRWTNLRDTSQAMNINNSLYRVNRNVGRMNGRYYPIIGEGYATAEEAAAAAESLLAFTT